MNSGPDPDGIVNLLVWETIDDLHRFLALTVHGHFEGRKAEWFAAPGQAHAVMWCIHRDHRPTDGGCHGLPPGGMNRGAWRTASRGCRRCVATVRPPMPSGRLARTN